jgi:hypothetical protein
MTNLGRAKEAAAFANSTTVEITHIAIGDGAIAHCGHIRSTELTHKLPAFDNFRRYISYASSSKLGAIMRTSKSFFPASGN